MRVRHSGNGFAPDARNLSQYRHFTAFSRLRVSLVQVVCLFRVFLCNWSVDSDCVRLLVRRKWALSCVKLLNILSCFGILVHTSFPPFCLGFTPTNPTHFLSVLSIPGSVDDASTSEASIKEEPVDPIELRRLQQLTANGQFLNGNYQFPNVNGNGTTFTPLTPASVLHHQPHVPGLKCNPSGHESTR
jgi:hypothetical protein